MWSEVAIGVRAQWCRIGDKNGAVAASGKGRGGAVLALRKGWGDDSTKKESG